jgi:hypothetical protein
MLSFGVAASSGTLGTMTAQKSISTILLHDAPGKHRIRAAVAWDAIETYQAAAHLQIGRMREALSKDDTRALPQAFVEMHFYFLCRRGDDRRRPS